jgi:ATP-dependent DNA helicase PIF1
LHHNHPKDPLPEYIEGDTADDVDSENETVEGDEEPGLDQYHAGWMHEAARHPGQAVEVQISDLGNRELDTTYDWIGNSPELGSIVDASQWLEDQVKQSPNDNAQELPIVDYRLLKGQQRLIFLQVMAYFKKLLTEDGGPKPEPFRINIDGTAGTGKSFLIWAIATELRVMFHSEFGVDPVVRLAPTGIAAYGIRGWTLNFGLSIPVRKAFSQLSGTGLARSQARWRNVRLLIIDEKSMVGRTTFGKVDRHLRQIFPEHSEEILGGLPVLLCGDLPSCHLLEISLYTQTRKP